MKRFSQGVSLTCLFKVKTGDWSLTEGIPGFESFGIPLWPPFDSYSIPYLMQKHHRGRSPTSRPDHSFTAKLLCCAAHSEAAAWSRGHRAQQQAAPVMDKASEDQLPDTSTSSLPGLLSDFCLYGEMLTIIPTLLLWWRKLPELPSCIQT